MSLFTRYDKISVSEKSDRDTNSDVSPGPVGATGGSLCTPSGSTADAEGPDVSADVEGTELPTSVGPDLSTSSGPGTLARAVSSRSPTSHKRTACSG